MGRSALEVGAARPMVVVMPVEVVGCQSQADDGNDFRQVQ